MLTHLLGRGARAEAPEVPAGSRIYAIGDIHGCDHLLTRLHRLIHEDAWQRQAPRNVVIYLGDYVDRGPDSRAVLDFLIDHPLPGFEQITLKGNHEDAMLDFLDDLAIGPDWLFYGGTATLLSYGVEPPLPFDNPYELSRAQRELRERVPERHMRFLRKLALTHIEGDYFFVHAGIRPDRPLENQETSDLLWIRDTFLRSRKDFGKIIVHGHTITERPDVQRNRIGIDTGAFASGHLTCLVLEGAQWSFLQT